MCCIDKGRCSVITSRRSGTAILRRESVAGCPQVPNKMRYLVVVAALVCLAGAEIREKGWWKNTVFYQVFPRSFKDNAGDGIGDLKGLWLWVYWWFLNEFGQCFFLCSTWNYTTRLDLFSNSILKKLVLLHFFNEFNNLIIFDRVQIDISKT